MPAYPVISDGPCTPWANAEDVQGKSSVPADADVNDAIAAASYVLWAMSARQFSGDCIGFVRPCAAGCAWGFGDSGDNGVNLALAGADWWFGWGSGVGGGSWGWWNGQGATCGCKPLSQIKLAGYPVREILEVTIDGAAIDASEYRLDFNRFLVRMADDDGHSRYWPSCQDLDRPPTEDHTWAVKYLYGAPPPSAGVLAAVELAVQFWLAINNPAKCTLPTGVTKLTRQGVTIERLLPMFGFDEKGRPGRTGLPMTDAFLSAVNPSGLRRRPAVRSPGYPRYPRRTSHPPS